MRDQHGFNLKAWLLWTAGFLAFPIAGVLAEAVTGRVNDLGSAMVWGMVAGAVIGTGSGWSARRSARRQTWIPATALAMGIGTCVWRWVVGYGTSGRVGNDGASQASRRRRPRPTCSATAWPNAWAAGAASRCCGALGGRCPPHRRRGRQPVREGSAPAARSP